ncbi:hypothetical protein [Nocardioides ultimimeridianus]
MDSLSLIAVSGRQARLGEWGTLNIEGPHTAVLRLRWAGDVELPHAVARDLTAGVLVLNDELGRLVYLPYAGAIITAYDLREGECLTPPFEIPRDPDRGMRTASARLARGLGILHLTEATMALVNEDCTLGWIQIGDFRGWGIEGVRADEVDLLFEDWSGSMRRESWNLSTGQRFN